MKTLVISDLVTMRSALLQLAGICAIVGAFISIATQSFVAASAATAIMIPLMFLFTTSAYDETRDWELFRLTLPVTRRQVVLGRYASILLVALLAVVLASVLGVLLALAAGAVAALAPVPLPEGLVPHEGFVAEIVAGAAVSSVIALVAGAVTLPLIMRFGMTKGARLVPVVIVLLMSLGILLAGDDGPLAGMLTGLEAWLFQGANLALVCVAGVVATLAVYAVSAQVAVGLYERREL